MSNGTTRSGPAQRLLELAGSLAVVVLSVRYLLMFFHRGANLLDEGSQVEMANRILHGDVIYRDFLAVVTPGSFYTVAWLFQIFGANLMVVRWAVFGLSLGILIVTLIIARRLMSWPFAAASALLTVVWGWFLVAPNLYSWEAMFFALVALACYLRGWPVAAGLGCGAAILVKQNTGIYATGGLLCAISLSGLFDASRGNRERWADTRSLFGGVSLTVVPVLVCLVYIGAGPHLYENWIYYPLQMYPEGLKVDYPAFYPLVAKAGLGTLREVLPQLLTEQIEQPAGWEIWQKFVLYLPWLVYPFALLALVVLLMRRSATAEPEERREGHALLAVTSFGAFTFLQAWPRADVTHILFGMQPAFVLLGYACFSCWRLSATRPHPWAIVWLVVTLIPHALLLRNGYKYTEFGYHIEYVPIKAERAGGVRTSVRNAAQIDQVTEYITARTRPDDPIFVVPWAAGFYFLTDRPNPTQI